MKLFLKYLTIAIFSSFTLLTVMYLFSFTPLDSNGGSTFSNGFITGAILLLWGSNKIRINRDFFYNKSDKIYGIKANINDEFVQQEKSSNKQIPAALALFVSSGINFSLSFFL